MSQNMLWTRVGVPGVTSSVVVGWLVAQDLWPEPNHATPHPQYGSSDAIHMSAFVITVGRGAASVASDTNHICRH